MKDLAELSTLLPASPELQAKIRAELNEEESGRERDIGHIRAWLAQQPHLPRIDDKFILGFLRGCKFSLEKVKTKLDMLFSMRTGIPHFFISRDFRTGEMTVSTERTYFAVAPRLTPAGHRVSLVYIPEGEKRAPVLLHVIRIWFMLYDIRLCEEREPVAGDVYVVDGRLMTTGYLSQWTPAVAKHIFSCMQDAYPVRIHAIHMVHMHPLVTVFFNFIKPFLTEKLRNRFYFHSKLDTLHKVVSKECLPTEFGGSAGDMKNMHDAWLEKLRQYGDWFRQQEQVKADESLRPGKPRNYDAMFGVEGSFRKLAID